MIMDMHSCPDCGLAHGSAGEMPESDEVKIARLNKERDVEIARLQARQDKDWNETRVEVAEIEAGAEVDAAVATAELVGDAIEAGALEAEAEPGPDPVVVVDAPEPEPEPDLAPPADVTPAPAPRSKGLWPYG